MTLFEWKLQVCHVLVGVNKYSAILLRLPPRSHRLGAERRTDRFARDASPRDIRDSRSCLKPSFLRRRLESPAVVLDEAVAVAIVVTIILVQQITLPPPETSQFPMCEGDSRQYVELGCAKRVFWRTRALRHRNSRLAGSNAYVAANFEETPILSKTLPPMRGRVDSLLCRSVTCLCVSRSYLCLPRNEGGRL